ncbi:NXPE family member 3-like [Mizuhopecten yessoensis]|uniref:NXPE family member 3 n=1 Tax=Mizuhopecten yessoensis TaxID=6573 RepID=A0A210QPW4_MIZYE|nr:NXPE family member 3-like [Mizuhopecten yessoensis]XP_021352989.1 NXPE family member 3-like [Mizuhopecten yessoensis]OWF50775.1 NXPE family member 3 [Mizuhopecten yessoensis]
MDGLPTQTAGMRFRYKRALSAISICCGIGFLWCMYQFATIQDLSKYERAVGDIRMFDVPGPHFFQSINSISDVLRVPHSARDSNPHLLRTALQRYNAYTQLSVSDPDHFFSVNNSKIEIQLGPFQVGDTLKVRIILYDNIGAPIATGGDHIRIWLRQKSTKSNVNGYTIDHGDGTYTGVLTLPWAGSPEVIVSMGNTREHIAFFLNTTETHGLLYEMSSQFISSDGKHKEATKCSPLFEGLSGCHESSGCNLTEINYGIPWFCCQPKSRHLDCNDMKKIKCSDETNFLNTDMITVSDVRHVKFPPIKIKVSEGKVNSLQSPPGTCYDRPRADTWEDSIPAGYYFHNQWVNLHCSPKFRSGDYISCFRNKRFVVLGDSNSRGTFVQLVTMSGSTYNTSEYTKGDRWHKLLEAHNKDLNLELMWAPHNAPLFVKDYQGLDTMRSVGSWLDEITADRPIVVVIHFYYHLTKATIAVYKAMVRDARKALLRLWKRAPDTAVFIQGPHSITYTSVLEPLDYLRRCHGQIWYEEFKGLHDRIVYLDWWDMTVSSENVDVHPSEDVQMDLTRVLVSYLCPSH